MGILRGLPGADVDKSDLGSTRAAGNRLLRVIDTATCDGSTRLLMARTQLRAARRVTLAGLRRRWDHAPDVDAAFTFLARRSPPSVRS